jgi:hypothetical protein
MIEDISPAALPLTAKIKELEAKNPNHPAAESAKAMATYLDLSKRMLLEFRVREFNAYDVVALAVAMEGRERMFLAAELARGGK